jgi:hypothetical protein
MILVAGRVGPVLAQQEKEILPDSSLIAEMKKIPGFENKRVRPLVPLRKGPHPGPPDNPTTRGQGRARRDDLL